MSYCIIDSTGAANDFATSQGIVDLEATAGPNLTSFLDTGEADEALAKEIVTEVKDDDATAYIADLFGGTAPFVLSNGIAEDDEDDEGAKYSDDQPRDESGRWSPDGGSSEGESEAESGFDAERSTVSSVAAKIPELSGIGVRYGATGDMLATKSDDHVILNESVWNDKELMAQREKDWAGCLVDATPNGIIVHELGHILDGQIVNALGGKAYNEAVAKYLPDPKSISNTITSPYGQENNLEFMAESFASYYFQKGAGNNAEFDRTTVANSTAMWEDLIAQMRKAKKQ